MLPIVAQVGASSIGLQFTNPVTAPATQPLQPSPNAPVDPSVVMADFARRLRGLEQAIKITVPNDRILSAIALTSDAALISSNKVAIVGEVTFADWHRDVSGNPSGTLDPGITQIRGGVIRTGMIENLAATAWVNLDASGSTNFLQCGSAVAVGANGHFTFGDATTGRQFSYDGANIGLGGSVINLQTGTSLSAIESNASAAYSGLSGKLSKSGTDVLSAAITFNTSSGFKTAGFDTGNGVAFTDGGIAAKKSGAYTFTLSSSGDATLAGIVDTGGYVYARGITTATISPLGSVSTAGYFTGVSGAFPAGVVGVGNNGSAGYGVIGWGATVGVYGNGSIYGVYSNGAFYTAGGATITGALSAASAAISGSLSCISFQGYATPGNILAANSVTAGSPGTAFTGYITAQLLSGGGTVRIPFI